MLKVSLALSGLLLAGLSNTGCIVHGRARVGGAVYAEPALVEVSPGVMVVEDYDEPVFYSDGFYWRYYGGIWYRSSYHTGGWVTWRNPPARVIGIRNPRGYVRYRARPGVVRVRAGARGGGRYRAAPARGRVRDGRDDRRDNRRHHH